MTHVELHQKGKRIEAILNHKSWIKEFDNVEEATKEFNKLSEWLGSKGHECTTEHDI